MSLNLSKASLFPAVLSFHRSQSQYPPAFSNRQDGSDRRREGKAEVEFAGDGEGKSSSGRELKVEIRRGGREGEGMREEEVVNAAASGGRRKGGEWMEGGSGCCTVCRLGWGWCPVALASCGMGRTEQEEWTGGAQEARREARA